VVGFLIPIRIINLSGIFYSSMDQVKAKKWYFRWWMWIVYIAVVLFMLSSITSSATEKAKQVAQNGGATASDDSDARLELISHSCGREYGYFKLTGQVKNISDKPIENVQAVGSLYTKDRQFVKSETAIIEYNPILPGQTSPYTVMGTDNPAIESCEIEFKELMGGSISTKID